MKSKLDLVKNWIKKAKRDLEVAKREIKREAPYTDISGFHAQQAAEKYLKGYLVWLEIEPKKTHDLEDLVLLVGEKDKEILFMREEVAELTPYAIVTRYPEFSEPSLEDAKRALQIAEKVKSYVLEKLPDEVKT
jgi:HEPN domain-containing protein